MARTEGFRIAVVVVMLCVAIVSTLAVLVLVRGFLLSHCWESLPAFARHCRAIKLDLYVFAMMAFVSWIVGLSLMRRNGTRPN